MQMYCVCLVEVFLNESIICALIFGAILFLQRYLPTTILLKFLIFYQEKKVYSIQFFTRNFPTLKRSLSYSVSTGRDNSLYVNFTRVWIGQFRCNRLHKFWRFHEKRQVFVNVLEDLGTKAGWTWNGGALSVQCPWRGRGCSIFGGKLIFGRFATLIEFLIPDQPRD